MIRFSVIVPAYRVEQYLSKCIESIIRQTYLNLEIILVNDGSPDGCLQIMEYYAAKDKRIRVISQTNMGLSEARNAGLKIATGDYVAFVDSDDWIEKEMFEVLAAHLDSKPSDYTCFRLQFDNEKTGTCLWQTLFYNEIRGIGEYFERYFEFNPYSYFSLLKSV